MLAHIRPTVWRAERAGAEGGMIPALRHLRRLGLAEFGDVLLALPDPEFPALSHLLPRTPPDAVQIAFHGSAGKALMHDGVSVLRVAAAALPELTGRRARDARILDFGCGWGRLLRLLPYFSDPDRLAGLDASASAIELASEHGMPGVGAPIEARSVDLAISHSLFTHLSPADMDAAMADLHGVVAERGLIAVTVRPIEFWDFLAQRGDPDAAALRARHLQDGHAFRPAAKGGKGDMSVDLDWFAARHPQWDFRGADRGWDELETVLLLTPR